MPPTTQFDPPPPVQPAAAAVPAERRYRGGAANAYIGADNILRTTHAHVDFDLPVRWLGAEAQVPGFDYITLDLSIDPTLSLVNGGGHWLYVGAAIGNTFILDYETPKTPSGSTRFRYVVDQSVFHNIPLWVGYAHTFVDHDDGLFFRAGPEASVSIPTEGASDYVDLYTSVSVAADAYLPLRKGEAFNSLFMHAYLGWSHTFLDEEDAPIRFDSPSGSAFTFNSASLSPRDAISMGIAAWINVWGDLSVGSAWGLWLPFNYPSATDPCVGVQSGGCASIPGGPVDTNSYVGSLQLSLGYLFARMLRAELSYSNASREFQAEGGIFYSPDAVVSLSASLLIDHMVERVRR
ncbi:MAG: hypothetical protein WKG00_21735 [Polyangiaceae bacterium]